ncbi:hypothetical protein AB7C87_10475 [Natrarchaeobius sp. A-rgal3]|uniref:hypothetical protein n=1 Tax=Natrarchaeobius versutus TaxID=1679078 RepID=UPI00351073E7
MTWIDGDGRWRRLRPETRDDDLADGLAATIHDPLWTLARQWHVGEFRGEDAGTPVDVDLTIEHDPITRFERRGDGGGEVVAYEGGPLESAIERERVLTADPPARVTVEAGRAFLETLAEEEIAPNDGDAYAASDFPSAYLLAEPDEAMPDADRRYYRVMAGRALDGHAVFEALEAAGEDWSAAADEDLPIPEGASVIEDGEVDDTYRDAAERYCSWYVDLFDEPDGTGDAWRPTRLEYEAAVVTGDGDDENAFGVEGYRGGRLEWHDFSPTDDEIGDVTADDDEGEGESQRDEDGRDDGDTGGGATPVGELEGIDRTVPTRVSVPGMPSPRWWEREDAGLLFGDVAVDGLSLVRPLVHEFALTAGTDWFRLPIEDVPIGSLTRIPDVTVTDSFGVTDDVDSAEDDDWRLFSHDLPNDDHHQGLFLAPTVSDALESDPVEEVLFGRDPIANLVFSLEGLVEGTTGDPVDRTEFTRPRAEIVGADPHDDPDEESLELSNPGDDTLDLDGFSLAAEADGDLESYGTLESVLLGPGERRTVYTGVGGERDGVDLEVGESALVDADAVALVRPAPDANGTNGASEEPGDGDDSDVGDDPDGDDSDDSDELTPTRIVAKRPLSSVDDADAAYQLSTVVPDHWFPFTVERDGADEDGIDVEDAAEWEYRLKLSVLLDAESLDRPLEEIPTPDGRILDPDPATLPDDEDALSLYEETITRSGRAADRRYQYVHWADGTVRCWSGRTVRPGYGELSSRLGFDALEDRD